MRQLAYNGARGGRACHGCVSRAAMDEVCSTSTRLTQPWHTPPVPQRSRQQQNPWAIPSIPIARPWSWKRPPSGRKSSTTSAPTSARRSSAAARRSRRRGRNRIPPPRHGLLPADHRDRGRPPAPQSRLGIAVSSATQTVRVDLADAATTSKSARAISPQAGPFLTDRGKVSHAVLITDENVQEPHALRVAESLSGRKVAVDLVAVKPGEPSKSIDVAASLWEGMLHSTPIAARWSSPSAAAWSATWPASSPPPSPAACDSCRSPPRSWPRSIVPSAARWASICPRPRTWSGPSTSRWAC